MEKIIAYEILVDIKKIINDTRIFVEMNANIPAKIIEDLKKLGEMSKKLEAYVLTKDNDFIENVEQTQRYT